MKRIDFDEFGSSIDIIKSINSGDSFIVLFEGALAKAFIAEFGINAISLTPEHVKLIVTVVAIMAVAGLALYALANGYDIEGEAEDQQGNKYRIKFRKKS